MNNDNVGCIGSILAFAFVVGNLFLFSGALADDLSDNGIAWFMVIIAVIGDIALIIWGLSSWSKSVEQKQEQQRLNELAETEKAIDEFIEIKESLNHDQITIKRAHNLEKVIENNNFDSTTSDKLRELFSTP